MITWFLLFLWLFYLGFVLYAGCQAAIARAVRTKSWRDWMPLVPVSPVLLVVFLMDVIFNQVGGRFMFLEWTYTLTLSQRFDLHYLDSNWRGSIARDFGNVLNKILLNHIHI